MDIICKDCGHGIDDHLPDGCFHCENGTTSVNNTCLCDQIPSEVATMFFTEQQARLDTCRGEIETLNLQKEQVRRKFHSIIGNLHEPEKILEICDKTLREFFND